GGDNGAAVVGPGWAADRPGRGVVVEESLAEMVERQPATIGGKLLAHALDAIDRAWRLGEARVLHLGARWVGDPVIGVHVEAAVRRQPERLVGRAFEAERLTP